MFSRLHFERFGAAGSSPVVLLHGFLGNINDWDQVFQRLGDKFAFLAIDLPGHGKSQNIGLDFDFDQTTAAIIDILDGEGIVSCPLLGYSMGGRIALFTAIKHPARFSTLILESCSAGIQDGKERRNRIKFEEQIVHKLARLSMPEFLADWYNINLFNSLREHPQFKDLLARRADNDPIALSQVVKNLGSGHMSSLWQKMQKLAMPIHYIYGEKDHKHRLLAAAMSAQAKTVFLYNIKDSGHNTHFENPIEFCNVLQQILSKQE